MVKTPKALARGIVLTIALCSLATGCAFPRHEAQRPLNEHSWRLVYRNDADGKPLFGDKAALLAAIRSGAPIRLAWGVKIIREGRASSVEHAAEPVFVSIVNESDVVVHLPEHIAQRNYLEAQAPEFENAAVMWQGVMSTSGAFDAVWVNRATGAEVRRLPQRVGLSWFALLPPVGTQGQPPVELAVPGGVRRADTPQ